MKNTFDIIKFIKNLLQLSPRQIENETKAANFIISVLKKHNIPYYLHYFSTKIPKTKKEFLIADKKKIPCRGCCFVSGETKNKDYLISSLIPSHFFIDKSNINFNPQCKGISLSNFYFAPALAISKKDLPYILKAKKVFGKVIVEPIKHKAVNILVGNKKNPKTICFAHYDSIEKGAIDNAAGVAVLMKAIILKPKTLENNLYVFSANEELSYEKPTYWGYGFRAFEKKFLNIMIKTKKIIVIDCPGNNKTNILEDDNLAYLAFPIKNKNKFKNKIKIITGDIEKLMNVYHSDLDDLSQIKEKYLNEAVEKLLNEVY